MSKRTGWGRCRWVLIVMLGVGVVAGVHRLAPHPLAERISSVQFHLGTDHAIQPVTIVIHGSWRYTLKGNRRFYGTIGIYGPGQGNPHDYEQRTLTTTIYPFSGGALVWIGSQDDRPFAVMKGSLFADPGFHQVAIYGSISGLIAGPADSRAAGLRIANRVMRRFLGRTILR